MSIKKFLALLAVLSFFLWFLWHTISQMGVDNIMHALTLASPLSFIFFILLSLINFGVFTWRWKVLLSGEKIPPFMSLYGFRLVAYTLSYFIPSAQVGGEPARILLVVKSGTPKEAATASVILDKVFELAVSGGFSALAFCFVFSSSTEFGIAPLLVVLATLAFLGSFFYLSIWGKGFFSTIVGLLHIQSWKKITPLLHSLTEVEQHIKSFFHGNLLPLLKTIALSLLCFLLMIAEYGLIFYFLGVQTTPVGLLLVTALPLVGYLFPSPGAVGALETTQIIAFQLAHIDPIYAIPTLLIIRLRDVVLVALGIICTSRYGLNLFTGSSSIDISKKPL